VLKAADGGEAAAGGLIRGALGLAALLAAMAAPFCPGAADSLRTQLGLPPFTKRDTPLAPDAVATASADVCSLLETGAALGAPATLFRTITKDEEAELRAKFGGGGEEEGDAAAAAAAAGAPATKKDGKKAKPAKPAAKPAPGPVDVSRLDLRVGRVLSARKHPDADSLYVEEVDLGEGAPRTVCSGLVGKVPLETLATASVVCVCNLKPVAMRGVESQAMVLAATSADGGTVELVAPPPGAAPGARVSVKGFDGAPDAEINLKKKNSAWATIQPDLATTADRVVAYKGAALTVGGEACAAPTVAGGTVG
jgi:methionyl-tRNA synthetase